MRGLVLESATNRRKAMKLIPVYSSNGKKLVAYSEAEEAKKRRRRRRKTAQKRKA